MSAEREAAALSGTRTSAVITYNDDLALGVMHRLARDGVRVPDEVSVVGYDDIPAARLVTPSLTTIAAPTRAQGIVAVHHLLSIIKGARPHSDEPTVLPVHLTTRESSGRLSDRQSAGLNRSADAEAVRNQGPVTSRSSAGGRSPARRPPVQSPTALT